MTSSTARNWSHQRSPEGAAKRKEIVRLRAEYKERGEKYPSVEKEDLRGEDVLWIGHIPYDWETLAVVKNPNYIRRPVTLPDDFVLDGEKRLPYESDQQYQWYCAYRELPRPRTFQKFCAAIGVPYRSNGKTEGNGNWPNRAKRWRWKERVELWEADLHARVEVALEKKTSAAVDTVAERRIEYLEREIGIVEQIYERLEEMLAMPAVDEHEEQVVHEDEEEVEGEDGNVVTINKTVVINARHVHAANWSYGDIAKLVSEIDKIARLHYGMSTSNAAMKLDQTVSGTISVQGQAQHDFGNMSPTERAAHEYAARKAEDAYFAALAEYSERPSGAVIDSVAREAAD